MALTTTRAPLHRLVVVPSAVQKPAAAIGGFVAMCLDTFRVHVQAPVRVAGVHAAELVRGTGVDRAHVDVVDPVHRADRLRVQHPADRVRRGGLLRHRAPPLARSPRSARSSPCSWWPAPVRPRCAPTSAPGPSARSSTRCGCWASTRSRRWWCLACWPPLCVALLLNSIVSVIGLAGGFFFSVFVQHVTPGAFAAGMTILVGPVEVIVALCKAALFGLAASLIACYKGISVGGGPAGVGNAVNETVVFSFMALVLHQRDRHRDRRRRPRNERQPTVQRQIPAPATRGRRSSAAGWNRIGLQMAFYTKTHRRDPKCLRPLQGSRSSG